MCVCVCVCVCQVKKAGEKGWTDFQALWSGPQEEGVEMAEEDRQYHDKGGGGWGVGGGRDWEAEEEGTEDLLGSFSDEPAHPTSKQDQNSPQSSKKSSRSYGSTDYGSVTNQPAPQQSDQPSSPSWDDPSWGPSGGWDSQTASGGRGEEDKPLKPKQSTTQQSKPHSGTTVRESDGWGDSWGWDTADLRTSKTD